MYLCRHCTRRDKTVYGKTVIFIAARMYKLYNIWFVKLIKKYLKNGAQSCYIVNKVPVRLRTNHVGKFCTDNTVDHAQGDILKLISVTYYAIIEVFSFFFFLL